ncbi:LacI family DNA-binding transcriptional regulator [Brachybacterium sp. AOP43-C2-M15]|uniref:LacI family DNA-binding transcriptional regulator n=1 Tax=Brachybacterium sp. AOP43-C2-M15 TaxID=3457661 RepID=UPI0040335551
MKAPTSQDVARLAGVSQSTVSYVLTGTRSISEETRRRVEAAVQELGYHPNSGARTLRSRRSGVIGLMVPARQTRDSGPMPFIVAISQEARRFDLDVLVVTADEGAAGVRRLVGTGLCDALILMEISRQDERLDAVTDSGLPCVSLGKPDIVPGASVVDLDFEMLGRMVVEGALAERCTRLLLFGRIDEKEGRNDVSRFLRGLRGAAPAELEVVIAPGSPAEVVALDLTLDEVGGRTAYFGLSQELEMLFALAIGDRLEREDRVFIALSDHDLGAMSAAVRPLLRLTPRQRDVSAVALRELVRLLREPGAGPRTTLLPPRWADAPGDEDPDRSGDHAVGHSSRGVSGPS